MTQINANRIRKLKMDENDKFYFSFNNIIEYKYECIKKNKMHFLS